jgi:hypothetical protein
MTPERDKIWRSPGGVSLFAAWFKEGPMTPEAELALVELKALNARNGIGPLRRADAPGRVQGQQLQLDFGEGERSAH